MRVSVRVNRRGGRYETPWPMRKFVQKAMVHKIVYHEPAQCFVVAVRACVCQRTRAHVRRRACACCVRVSVTART